MRLPVGWGSLGNALDLTQCLYNTFSKVGAGRADSVLKCCEASKEGVIGGTFRGWPQFTLTRWKI
jgi:hypothetical protein